MRGAHKRGVSLGATNLAVPLRNKVELTIMGDEEKVNSLVEELTSFARTCKPLNSWGATISDFQQLPSGRRLEDHQVTTANVDGFKWSSNVEFYF